MVLPLIVGAAAVGSGALNSLFGYNRENWMTDIALRQYRNYQKQDLRLSRVGMHRDDIRDLVQLTLAKTNNYMVVVALHLYIVGVFGLVLPCSITHRATAT
jgi:hypothetical protein